MTKRLRLAVLPLRFRRRCICRNGGFCSFRSQRFRVPATSCASDT
jgi:hypothetical protein